MSIPNRHIPYWFIPAVICLCLGCGSKGLESEPTNTGSVSGRVYSATASPDNTISYSSFPRVTVYVRERPCGSSDPAYCEYVATTRPVNGTFTFKDIPAGGYWFIARPDDYRCGDSHFVEVVAGRNTEMDSLIIVESCGLLLYGRVRYEDGSAYTTDTLQFFVSNTSGVLGELIGTVVTSDDGAYAFDFWSHYDYLCFQSPRGSVLVYDTAGYIIPWCSIYDCNCFPIVSGRLECDPVITAEE